MDAPPLITPSAEEPRPGPPPDLPHTTISPRNPGTIEELHRKTQMIFPMPFEGGTLAINKGVSSHLEVNHTLTLNQSAPSGYKFGATYVGTNRPSLTEAYPILMGDIDANGDMNANIIHAFTNKLRCRSLIQIAEKKWQSLQVTSDYKSDDYTASLTIANPDLKGRTGIAVCQYLRAISKRFSLGTELTYQAAPQIPGGHVGVMAIAGRFEDESTTVSATIGTMGLLHATACHKVSDTFTLAADVEANAPMRDVNATIGYEYKIGKDNEFVIRSSINTNLEVKSVVEKKILPLPFTLALCSMLNHRKNKYSFGIGLTVA